MKYAYLAMSAVACALGTAYIFDGNWLVGMLWLTSGILDAVIAGMSD